MPQAGARNRRIAIVKIVKILNLIYGHTDRRTDISNNRVALILKTISRKLILFYSDTMQLWEVLWTKVNLISLA